MFSCRQSIVPSSSFCGHTAESWTASKTSLNGPWGDATCNYAQCINKLEYCLAIIKLYYLYVSAEKKLTPKGFDLFTWA